MIEILFAGCGLFCLVRALKATFNEGENQRLRFSGAVLIGFYVLLALGVCSSITHMRTKGIPKPIDQAKGAFIRLSRVDDGENSYVVAKDTEGNIKLLRAEENMPDFRSFVVKNGEVTEFK